MLFRSYDLAGGTVASPNPTTFHEYSSDITLVNPTKAGYYFMGWTGTGLNEPTMTVTIPTGSTGNRTYTATWVATPLTEDTDEAEGTAAHWYVNMPKTGTETVTLSDATVTTFKVYDNGGKNGDYSYYWLADRAGRTLQRLNELYAMTDQVGFKLTERLDGRLILPEAVKCLQMKA